MILASTLTDIATLVGTVALLIPACAAAFATVRASLNAAGMARIERKVEGVHDEVRTGNGETLGALADIAEGRAAQAIPPEDRTEDEQHHVEMKEAAEGPPISHRPAADQ